MKYTRYIIHGRPIRPEQLGVIGVPIAIVGVLLLSGLMPGALFMDTGRYIRLRYVLFKREQKRVGYIKCVIRSLDQEVTRELINSLRAA